MQIADTLTFLLGDWKLDRVIDDHRSGTHGWLTGRAVIAARGLEPGAGLALSAGYDESGRLSFGTQVTRTSRSLLYARSLGGDALMLHFADGRPFVDLDLSDGEWQAIHDCVEDRYEITTTVRSQDLVEERWRVTGPEKEYDAVTTLTRLPLQSSQVRGRASEASDGRV